MCKQTLQCVPEFTTLNTHSPSSPVCVSRWYSSSWGKLVWRKRPASTAHMACARTCAPLWSRYSRMNDYLPTYLLVFCPCSLHNMYSITLLSCCIQLFGRDRVLSESLNKSLYQSVLWRCILYTACLIHDALLLHVCLCGILQNRVLICASFQKKCVLMEISLDKANKIKWVKNNITRGVVCACLGCSSLFLPSSSRCPLSLSFSLHQRPGAGHFWKWGVERGRHVYQRELLCALHDQERGPLYCHGGWEWSCACVEDPWWWQWGEMGGDEAEGVPAPSGTGQGHQTAPLPTLGK